MNTTIVTGYLMVIILLLVCLILSFGILIKVGDKLRKMENEVSAITSTDLLDPIPKRIEEGSETEATTEETTQESDRDETTGNAP